MQFIFESFPNEVYDIAGVAGSLLTSEVNCNLSSQQVALES